MGSPSLIVLMVSVDVKQHLKLQSSGAVRKSRWTSWAPVPNKPTVSVDVKQHFNNNNNTSIPHSSVISLMVSVDVKQHVYLLDLQSQAITAQ